MFLNNFESFLCEPLAVEISVFGHFLDGAFTLEFISRSHLGVKLLNALTHIEPDIRYWILSQS